MKNITAVSLLLFTLQTQISAQPFNLYHELKGFEDNDGMTHLFYSVLSGENKLCTESSSEVNNNIWHFNLEADTDSILLSQGDFTALGCNITQWNNIGNFVFPFKDFSKPIWIEQNVGCGFCSPNVLNRSFASINLRFGNPGILQLVDIDSTLLVTGPTRTLIAKAKAFYEDTFVGKTILTKSNGSNWDSLTNTFGAYHDSLLIDMIVGGISPDGTWYGFEIVEDEYYALVKTSDYADDKTVIYEFNNETYYIVDQINSEFEFDRSNDLIYLPVVNNFSYSDGMPTDYVLFQLDLRQDSTLSEFRFDAYSLDPDKAGHIYFADSTDVMLSVDHLHSSELFHRFDEAVTGLYKKPGSGILYVLTELNLYEINNGNSRLLRNILTNRETHPISVPSSIELHQNYPNPFNPTTTIAFELNQPSEVRLQVFDITGRLVQTLVNGTQTTGRHEINFNASGLSSGVYLYRLETETEVITKALTVVK